MATNSSRALPASIFNAQLYENILSLWLKDVPRGSVPNKEAKGRWYGLGDQTSKDSFDRQCKQIAGEALEYLSPANWPLPTQSNGSASLAEPFTTTIEEAGQNNADGMHKVDKALAISLLLDQFPRNIFRDPQDERHIFNHYDRMAVAVSRGIASPSAARTILSNLDQDERIRLDAGRRIWLYMPLMHSEDLADHRLLHEKLQEMKDAFQAAGDGQSVEDTETTIGFEDRHVVLIERFGRYPHRNKCLGREQTAEEKKYLDEGGERFGRQ